MSVLFPDTHPEAEAVLLDLGLTQDGAISVAEPVEANRNRSVLRKS